MTDKSKHGANQALARASRLRNPLLMTSEAKPQIRALDLRRIQSICKCLCCCLVVAGCATSSTLESRKQERAAVYTALPPPQKALVDQGKIQTGMSSDAVYLAWGPPSQVLEQETAQGHITVWLYHGQAVEEYRYWIGRHLETDYYPRNYISAEVIFQNGAVTSWRTLPKPSP
jgi:hypothetical protein